MNIFTTLLSSFLCLYLLKYYLTHLFFHSPLYFLSPRYLMSISDLNIKFNRWYLSNNQSSLPIRYTRGLEQSIRSELSSLTTSTNLPSRLPNALVLNRILSSMTQYTQVTDKRILRYRNMPLLSDYLNSFDRLSDVDKASYISRGGYTQVFLASSSLIAALKSLRQDDTLEPHTIIQEASNNPSNTYHKIAKVVSGLLYHLNDNIPEQ